MYTNYKEECSYQPGKNVFKNGMVFRKAASSGEETQLSFIYCGAGRSRMVGWSDRRKAGLQKSELLKRFSGNWLSGQAEDRPVDVEGPALGPTPMTHLKAPYII